MSIEDEALTEAKVKDRDVWYWDYNAEPGVAADAFERGWYAAQSRQIDREALADAMIAADIIAEDTRREAREVGSTQREPFLEFADAVIDYLGATSADAGAEWQASRKVEAHADEREVLRAAVGGILSNASNFPEKVRSRILGQDMGPLNDRLTDAILSAGYRKVKVTTDEREALIERVLKVTDDMRSGGWHSGKTVAEMGQKIYDILTESTKGY